MNERKIEKMITRPEIAIINTDGVSYIFFGYQIKLKIRFRINNAIIFFPDEIVL